MTMFHSNGNTTASPGQASTGRGAWGRNRARGANGTHMYTQKEAKKLILAEWKDWNGRTGDKSGHDKATFYEWLKEFRTNHLDFPTEVDRWQIVNVWLSNW